MNQELWRKFDKLRGISAGSEGLAEFFQQEDVRFSASDLATWGQFLSGRFGRAGGAPCSGSMDGYMVAERRQTPLSRGKSHRL